MRHQLNEPYDSKKETRDMSHPSHQLMRIWFVCAVAGWVSLLFASSIAASPQTLSERLKQQEPAELAALAVRNGDSVRGAMIYYNPAMTCVTCHESSTNDPNALPTLGPPLAEFNREATTEHLIQSLLQPSIVIADGYATETIMTDDGKQVTGLVSTSVDGKTVTVTDPQQIIDPITIAVASIDDSKTNSVSAMPEGLLGALPNEQAFLDLVAYLRAVKDGGPMTKQRLRPPESFFAVAPLPEYETTLDHQRLLSKLDNDTLAKGEATYSRFCARCHGDDQQDGSMPAAMKFDTGKFKYGNDPFSMYQTMTHGNGLMVAQRWMVPKQKYQVIHYIRERILKKNNEAQYFQITDEYASRLPAGEDLGPDPVDSKPWSDMDYGNYLFNTVEVGDDGNNIAYKGLSVRLDSGPGGVSQGQHWMMYEHDTMRVAAAWSGSGFIDYNGIHFNDRHAVHPRVIGEIALHNDHLPGWANPQTDSFDGDPRIVGRDKKQYGPLPESWLKYRGLYRFDDKAILNYTVGKTNVLEMPSMQFADSRPVFQRTLNLGARTRPLRVKIAHVADLTQVPTENSDFVLFASDTGPTSTKAAGKFDGSSYLFTKKTIDWSDDVSIYARVKTASDGTIICQTKDQADWLPGGTSLFIRDGKLVFDIGWVGAVTSKKFVADNQWHNIGLVWRPDDKSVTLYVDDKISGEGELEQGESYEDGVLRIGHTAENFPEASTFQGKISSLKIWQGRLERYHPAIVEEFKSNPEAEAKYKDTLCHWALSDEESETKSLKDKSKYERDLLWISTGNASNKPSPVGSLWCHVQGLPLAKWSVEQDSVCLNIPAGSDPLNIAVSIGRLEPGKDSKVVLKNTVSTFTRKQANSTVANLKTMTVGSAPRYPDVLTSKVQTLKSTEGGAFEVDNLLQPDSNPWACRMRFTGIDFVSDNSALVCAWDGSVWKVDGFATGKDLVWRRIAHGLFQPLGIRIFGEQVFVTCRDQIVALKDLNGDGYTDYYRAFNSDHQVTEHFHEFAMGLQSDEAGNLYYAKSARHAKKAIVPHHGTLLKVSADGESTEILANGFRAANGVCLNPDGSFYVTDQEGHWNPKNRINWVKRGGFYGNMMGYHDVTDESDSAMIEPMCWITNAFDRSPGELMWVPKNAWGSLGGSLLNLSYGMGQVFVVPHERVQRGEQELLQGGMCCLPIPLFPTGVMRGRFHSDGALYCCGMYAWAGNQQQPGGLYRIRKSDKPAWLPLGLNCEKDKIQIELSDEIPLGAKLDKQDFAIKVWDIQRTANYGSPHLNERELEIQSVELKENRRTIELTVAGLEPVRCMEIKCFLSASENSKFTRVIHNTIHALPEPAKN